ncbi:hypothetical protein HGM15179_003673 [Zosterops borbonicus]|uniref:Uncharacterized protein n=1 Tax=Zosterops borbonicus TaxID=364589 RepID=A0A8K1GSH2_9PASS|nr:hypothetical protein HGM15179_003673 [Zosterops borbonicus]
MSGAAAAKSEKLDEAQALARSCAGRPDFQPCDGLSLCATHSHGRCFRLHWCCHLGWCHCINPFEQRDNCFRLYIADSFKIQYRANSGETVPNDFNIGIHDPDVSNHGG